MSTRAEHDWVASGGVQVCWRPGCKWLRDPWANTRPLFKRADEPRGNWRYFDGEPTCDGSGVAKEAP